VRLRLQGQGCEAKAIRLRLRLRLRTRLRLCNHIIFARKELSGKASEGRASEWAMSNDESNGHANHVKRVHDKDKSAFP
jgi:hypothetical protein